jgi:hypothetical protein
MKDDAGEAGSLRELWPGRSSSSARDAKLREGRRPSVENVPMISCPHCGAGYLTSETLHEMERIKAHGRSLATPRNVAEQSPGVDR